jgi:cell division protein FtsQ
MPKWWRITLVTVLSAVIIGSVVGATTWLWRSGRVGAAIADFNRNILVRSAKAGFVVEDVVLEGRVYASLRSVIAAADLRRGDSMFGFDPDVVQERLTALPWIQHATVERRLPDTVRIRITERRPAALWQRQGVLSLVDDDGTVITTRGLGRFRNFIIIVGKDAPKHVPTLVALLQSEPALARRVSAAVRVGGRRWNLKLSNGIAVWLPEDDPLGAWRRLAELNLRQQILERDVKVVDLRLPDRMIVRPGKKRRAVNSKVGGKRT